MPGIIRGMIFLLSVNCNSFLFKNSFMYLKETQKEKKQGSERKREGEREYWEWGERKRGRELIMNTGGGERERMVLVSDSFPKYMQWLKEVQAETGSWYGSLL